MKLIVFFCLLLSQAVSGLALAATPPVGAPASGDKTKTPPANAPGPAAKPTPPVVAANPAGQATLDGYLAVLNDKLSLSKDEQADIRTYYLDDGAKLHTILNNDTLSPLEQTRQVDTLRETRNAKIVALLHGVDRAQVFGAVEADYRVALTVLAAEGALTPTAPPPAVPQPTQTPPGSAEPQKK